MRRALAGEEFVGMSEVGGYVFETWYGPLRAEDGAVEGVIGVGSGVPQSLPEGYGREVVRILQEALTNVRRHSGAENVRVGLDIEGDNMYAEVVDDGRGFDPNDSHVGVGQYSMRQRR